MNKKFSTLLMGGLLVAGTAIAGPNVGSLVEGTNKGLYQLKSAQNEFLAINAKGELVVYKDADVAKNIANTLWCTTVTVENQGKAPIFDFVNKGAEALLSVSMDEFAGSATNATTTAAVVGGEIAGWAFSKTFATGLEKNKQLFSYFKNDSVVGLKVSGANVVLVKEAAQKVAANTFTAFTLVEANAITLNADQINTKLGLQAATDGVKLKFTPDRNKTTLKNPFSDVSFVAEAGEGDFVYVKSGDKYLHVDTAYTNKNSDKFLAFNYKSKTDLDKGDLKNQGQFLFTYFPSKDSLIIQVKQVTRPTATQTWGAALNASTPQVTTNASKKNYVTVQDLVKADEIRIVTIADVKETDITLGFKGCVEANTDKVSLADGLYLIQNAKTNKYLASPIHINGTSAEYVTVDADAQNVMHMPAYQWVVLKTKTSKYFLETSPVSVTNREYPAVKYNKQSLTSLQLTQAAGSELYFCETLSSDSLKITRITDKNILSDKYLGYKYLTDDELMITNYAFNYFNPYTMDKYIAQVEGDSTLNALQEEPTFFELVPASAKNVAVAYGYKVSEEVAKRIAGLVTLERAQYTIKSGKSHIAVGSESRFVLTTDSKKLPATKFYFKENNETAKGCYYAFVQADFKSKLGVADQGLQALLENQVMNEVRTSAFTIGLADQPLYRRFNSVELDGAVEGNEDATKLLKFKERYVNDFLMDETNKNFQREGMNYLGIGAANIAKAGLSFNVRPFNIGLSKQYQIKPQYLIYVSDEARAAVDTIPCNATDHQHMTADGKPTDDPKKCFHATPGTAGFNRYNLLVSFADSADAAGVAEDAKLYTFGKYTRVGFVDAVEQDSVLYILGKAFEDVATKDLNMDAVKKAVKGIDLRKECASDKHHNYTWSFRYIDPTKAANEVETDRAFLIESNAEVSIAPENAAWLKNQNNCLVLSDIDESTFADAKTGGDNALIFNIEKGSKDDMATDNEEIATSEVTVIAGEGQLTIANAAGKKVVVSNILGQVVANTVLSSDNATVAAPAGVVVVAVEGEEAVKAIVK